MIVTDGIFGGNGSNFGGHNPIVIVPRIGRVILIHKGLGAGRGAMVFLAGDPLELVTVVFDILTSSVV